MSHWEEIKRLRDAEKAMELFESGLVVSARVLRAFVEEGKFPFAIRRPIQQQISDVEKLAENAKILANDFKEQLSKLQDQRGDKLQEDNGKQEHDDLSDPGGPGMPEVPVDYDAD